MELKFRSSIRAGFFIIFLALILWFIAQGLVFNNSECSFANQDSMGNNFYSKIKGQEINVIGWSHGTVGRDIAQLAMADAFTDAKKGNCKLAEEKIESALKKLSDHKAESLRVLNHLNKIYKKRNFKKIGVEYGPEQYREEFIDPETQQDLSMQFISIFKDLCPNQIQQFNDLYLIFPGPEFRFALDHKGLIEILPLGNDELIKKTFSIYSNESRFFPQQIDQLSSKGRHIYDQFIELTKNGQPLSVSKIEELTITLQEAEKSKVQKYFKEVSGVLSLVKERDKAFVDEILKSKSDIAIVIGNFHVSGFRDRLEYKCKKGDQ